MQIAWAVIQATVALGGVLAMLLVLCWHGLYDPHRPQSFLVQSAPGHVPFLRAIQALLVFGVPLVMDRASHLVHPEAAPNWVLNALAGFAVAYVVTAMLTERSSRRSAERSRRAIQTT